MVRQIGKWYDAYSGGAEFDLDDEDEEAFEHTRLHSKKIRYLINTQAQFMVGKAPDLKITCPEESNTDQGKPNESDMQAYLNQVLKKNLWQGETPEGGEGLLHRRARSFKGACSRGTNRRDVRPGRRVCL